MSSREKLIEATRRAILHQGHGSVTVKSIAKEAGLNHGLIHHYFGSKENLFVEVIRDIDRVFREGLAAQTSKGDLTGFISKKFLGQDESMGLVVEFMAMARTMPEVKKAVAQVIQHRKAYFAKFLQLEEHQAHLFMTSILGSVLLKNVGEPVDVERILKKLLESLGEK